MNILIQKIEPSDFVKCFEIERQCFPVVEMFPKHELPEILAKSQIALKAIVKDEIVGYALARHANRVGYLYSNAVLPHFRNKGIGSMLLKHRMHNLWQYCDIVQAHTKIGNRESARLLLKSGFKAIGYEPDFYDTNLDAVKWEVRV